MVGPAPGSRRRGDRGHFVQGVGRREALGHHPRQVRREIVGAAELEGDQDLARRAAVGSGRAQPPEERRGEDAASAAREPIERPGLTDRRHGLIADLAAVLLRPLQRVPAGVADAATEESLEPAVPAGEAAGREDETGGGAQQGVQQLLRERRLWSVDIGGGF